MTDRPRAHLRGCVTLRATAPRRLGVTPLSTMRARSVSAEPSGTTVNARTGPRTAAAIEGLVYDPLLSLVRGAPPCKSSLTRDDGHRPVSARAPRLLVSALTHRADLAWYDEVLAATSVVASKHSRRGPRCRVAAVSPLFIWPIIARPSCLPICRWRSFALTSEWLHCDWLARTARCRVGVPYGPCLVLHDPSGNRSSAATRPPRRETSLPGHTTQAPLIARSFWRPHGHIGAVDAKRRGECPGGIEPATPLLALDFSPRVSLHTRRKHEPNLAPVRQGPKLLRVALVRRLIAAIAGFRAQLPRKSKFPRIFRASRIRDRTETFSDDVCRMLRLVTRSPSTDTLASLSWSGAQSPTSWGCPGSPRTWDPGRRGS